MKLQIKFTITTADNTEKKVSKTFSNINENAGNANYIKFAQAYRGLADGRGLEVYLIKVDKIEGGNN